MEPLQTTVEEIQRNKAKTRIISDYLKTETRKKGKKRRANEDYDQNEEI